MSYNYYIAFNTILLIRVFGKCSFLHNFDDISIEIRVLKLQK